MKSIGMCLVSAWLLLLASGIYLELVTVTNEMMVPKAFLQLALYAAACLCGVFGFLLLRLVVRAVGCTFPPVLMSLPVLIRLPHLPW